MVSGPSDQGNGQGNDPHAPLDALGKRIDAMENRPSVVAPKVKARSAEDSSAFGRAFKLSTEFVAAVAIGGGMGYLGDRVFGSGPVLFLVFFVLGVGAGFLNVWRAAQLINARAAELAKEASADQGLDFTCDDDDGDDDGRPKGPAGRP